MSRFDFWQGDATREDLKTPAFSCEHTDLEDAAELAAQRLQDGNPGMTLFCHNVGRSKWFKIQLSRGWRTDDIDVVSEEDVIGALLEEDT